MTQSEIKYTDYVSSFVGIPYKWNSWDEEKGLDCRTMTVCFLRGLGYEIDGEDGMEMPTETQMKRILKNKEKAKALRDRYITGLKSKGEIIADEDDCEPLQNIQVNDIVMYETREIPHLGVYVGGDRLLAATREYGSLLLRLTPIKKAIIIIVRTFKREDNE